MINCFKKTLSIFRTRAWRLCSHKKALAMFYALAVSFMLVPLLSAVQINLDQIKIPEKNGWIEEKFETTTIVSKDKICTIINIKDAHCNYSGQKNLYSILDNLVKNYGIKLIAVEGNTGYSNLSYMRKLPKEKRLQMAEDLLKKGEISGEEYYDLLSDSNVLIWGVEDSVLYEENVKSFLKIDAIKDSFVAALEEYKTAIDLLKPKVFSKNVLELDTKINEYRNFSLPTKDFVVFLKDFAVSNKIDLAGFTSFNDYLYQIRKSKTIDLVKTQKEINEIVKELSKKTSDAEYKDLSTKIESYQKKEIKDFYFYSYLKDLAVNKRIDIVKYTSFNEYLLYIYSAEKNFGANLLREIDRIIVKCEEFLLKDSFEAARLYRLAQKIDLLIKMGYTALTSSEYEILKNQKDNLLSSNLDKEFLQSCGSKYKVKIILPKDIKFIQDNIGIYFNFYVTAEKRNEAFVRNLLFKMDEMKIDVACLITGGFHSSGLKGLINNFNCNYISVIPYVPDTIDMSHYVSVLKDKNLNLVKPVVNGGVKK